MTVRKYEDDWMDGILNHGNTDRIKNTMRRAMQGESITIGFLGGSITQGCLSSTPKTCYAYLVYQWWKKTFPKAEVTYINAGIGATTSQFGVARVESDLLAHKVDFTIVEFSVNDDDNVHFLETYEGLIRRIYRDDNKPAILIVNSVRYDNGQNAQQQHVKIGKHYKIPCISMKPTIYQSVLDGVFRSRDITEDDLHPNDKGHALMADRITWYLESVYEELRKEKVFEMTEEALPEPLTRNAYENSIRYQNDNTKDIILENTGFTADSQPQRDIREIFKKGWYTAKTGASITFEVEGSTVAVQYRKSVIQPAPIAKVIVDNKENEAVVLDANFEENWGDCLYIDTIAEHISNGKHQVKIEVIEGGEKMAVPFYLVSVIASQ